MTLSHREQIEKRSLAFIRRRNLIPAGSRLLVAVSGGPDSVCLLHVLCNLKDQLGVELHVAHLDHQLRGLDSKSDADFVRGLTRKLGVPATIAAADVGGYRSRHRISLEEAAREVRYRFLAMTARAIGADKVAIGHTRDDNVETILMHILRGTGTRGLRGLLPDAQWPLGEKRYKSLMVIRPLMEVTRSETESYCRESSLEPRVDESNRSLSLFRNRVRLELLPLLRQYNPGIDDALSRTGRIASDEFDFLEHEVNVAWERVVRRVKDTVILNKQELMALHPALKRHIFRWAIAEFVSDLKDIETRHIEELLAALDKPAGRAFELPGGLVFVTEYDRYLLGRDTAELCPFPRLEGESVLNVPGETFVSGWRVSAEIGYETVVGNEPTGLSTADQTEIPLSPPLRKGETGFAQADFSNLDACFDYDRVGETLSVHATRPGDRFQPLGLGASKKVGEFMIDARIPRSWRSRIPVAADSEGVVWVVGWRIDERAKVTEATKRVLRLQFERVER